MTKFGEPLQKHKHSNLKTTLHNVTLVSQHTVFKLLFQRVLTITRCLTSHSFLVAVPTRIEHHKVTDLSAIRLVSDLA